jgi:hypothetical protein
VKEQFPKEKFTLYNEVADEIERYVINRLRSSSTSDDIWFHMALKELVLAADKMRERAKGK